MPENLPKYITQNELVDAQGQSGEFYADPTTLLEEGYHVIYARIEKDQVNPNAVLADEANLAIYGVRTIITSDDVRPHFKLAEYATVIESGETRVYPASLAVWVLSNETEGK